MLKEEILIDSLRKIEQAIVIIIIIIPHPEWNVWRVLVCC